MEDILRLFTTDIFSLLLLIITIPMLSAGFPLTSGQNASISLLTLALPALAQWVRPAPVLDVGIGRRLIHFVPPATMTFAAARPLIHLYFFASTSDAAYAQLASTYATIGMGLILVIFVEPPSEFWAGGDDVAGDWRPTLLALGLFAYFCTGLQLGPLREFYGMTPLRQPLDYVVIIATTGTWTLVLRFVWRARLLERYLDVEDF